MEKQLAVHGGARYFARGRLTHARNSRLHDSAVTYIVPMTRNTAFEQHFARHINYRQGNRNNLHGRSVFFTAASTLHQKPQFPDAK